MPKALILTGISGSRVGEQLALVTRSKTIGSSASCDIVLQDRMVAPRHAEIRQVLERWFIVPLDPTSRVFVNGDIVASQGRILEGDLVTIGTATFKAAFNDAVEREVGGDHAQSGIPQIGDYLVRRGYISRSELVEAIKRQQEMNRRGRRVQLGDILYEMGSISRLQLDQALQEQRSDFMDRFRD